MIKILFMLPFILLILLTPACTSESGTKTINDGDSQNKQVEDIDE